MPLQHSKAAKNVLACGENHVIIKNRYRDFIEISDNNRWLYLNACISQSIEVMKTCLPQSGLLKSWIENKIEIGLISESVLTKSRDSCILTGHFNCTVWKRCWRTKKRQETLTNIILNIQMASIVITDGEIKFTSSDMSMTGDSIGWCQAASRGD